MGGYDVAYVCLQDGKVTLDPVLAASLTDPDVRDFFILMAICNTVIVSSIGRFKSRVEAVPLLDGSDTDKILNKMKYEAESPDEAALVKVCVNRNKRVCCCLWIPLLSRF